MIKKQRWFFLVLLSGILGPGIRIRIRTILKFMNSLNINWTAIGNSHLNKYFLYGFLPLAEIAGLTNRYLFGVRYFRKLIICQLYILYILSWQNWPFFRCVLILVTRSRECVICCLKCSFRHSDGFDWQDGKHPSKVRLFGIDSEEFGFKADCKEWPWWVVSLWI